MIWKRSSEDHAFEEISIKIHANALLLTLTDLSIQRLVDMVTQFVEYSQFMRHRCHRPQEGVMENPAVWWRHAGVSIVHEIDRVCSLRRNIHHSLDRRSLRKQYDAAYQRYRRAKRWGWLLMPFGTLKSALAALEALEQQLSTVEVAEFRWWSWTKWRKRRCKRFPHEEIKMKLIEIYNLLTAQAAISESATKWSLDVTVECPKVRSHA